ncbi:uncharacterized protein [Clytia hemisphaerica]|uniref:uncharacterized protein isoform X2 n=1 Tax=Clytia hemisphaerica TaxID=252671 RepID=UPI0034D4DED8
MITYIWLLLLSVFFFDLIGGPHECGVKSLPQNITCSHDQVITQKVTLCGKPQPAVTWKIGDKEINGTVDKTETDKHQYTYTLKTKLMSDMCGRELSYVANGYHRKRTASSMILMKDLGIKNVFQRSNQSESFISWGVKDYGLCDVEVQFSFSRTNITTKLVSASNKTFSYRGPRAAEVQTRYRTFVYVNLSSGERIRISQSGWKNVTYIKEKTTTTQKPTPTTTTKNRWGDIDNEDSDDEGEVSMFLLVGDIIGFVLLFILLGILWKLGKVVQRHHHKRKVSAKRSRRVMANRALKAVQDNAKPSTSKAKKSKRRQAQEAAIQEPFVQGQSTYDTVAEPVGQKSEEELSKLYAKVDKSNKKKPPVANVLYSELSALGGRTGDKTNAPKSEYAEAKDL